MGMDGNTAVMLGKVVSVVKKLDMPPEETGKKKKLRRLQVPFGGPDDADANAADGVSWLMMAVIIVLAFVMTQVFRRPMPPPDHWPHFMRKAVSVRMSAHRPGALGGATVGKLSTMS